MRIVQLANMIKFSNSQVYLTIKNKVPFTHDAYLYTFSLDDPQEQVHQSVTSHFAIQYSLLNAYHSGVDSKGVPVTRKFVSISPLTQVGTFECYIKIYKPNSNPQFPEGGRFTSWLDSQPIGSKLSAERGDGPFIWQGNGKCLLRDSQKIKDINKIFMVSGGSGITPMYQVIQRILGDSTEKTKVFLINGNKTEEDNWLRKELEQLQNSDRFQLNQILSKPSNEWKGDVGHVTYEYLTKHFPKPDEHTLALVCGPKAMQNSVLQFYKQYGVPEDNIFKF